MLNEKIQDAFNQQLNAELYSSYLYLSMAAYFESLNLSGFATWMKAQAAEEMMHAMKFYGFIIDRGGRVKLAAVEAPAVDWESPQAVFTATAEHEAKVTGLINKLMTLAKQEEDYASDIFLQWFVSEQVEEEASVEEVINKFKLMGDAPGGLFMLDSELGKRAVNLTPPPAA